MKVVDLFCGIGGLTHGFVRKGFNVVAWFDIDGSCQFWYEHNNNAKFYCKDIRETNKKDIEQHYRGAEIKVLIGCAPCQPFSMMNTKKWTYSAEDIQSKSPVDKFAELIKEVKPDIVSMENVPWLMTNKKSNAFENFVNILEEEWYKIDYHIVDCTKYGIPQTRKRLVLLASKLWEIELIPPTHEKPITVRETIGDLPKVKSWEVCKTDKYHTSQKLTDINMDRITRVPQNWWSLLDVDEKYRPKCYQKESWKSYLQNIYGRMRWDMPAPTMTTLCTWLGNGRFGHPEQDRALTVREVARIQTFPDEYQFFPNGECRVLRWAKFVGNAVPVRLGEVIAESIKRHLSTIK